MKILIYKKIRIRVHNRSRGGDYAGKIIMKTLRVLNKTKNTS